MTIQVQPYLFFEGRCEEALAFYEKALGAKRGMLMRYSDNPDPQTPPPGCAAPAGDKVMHADFTVGSTQLMASDGMATGQPSFAGIALSLTTADESQARRWFDALAEGGQVTMPMAKTFFSPAFGMVHDRFGVHWMVMVPQ
jgi:PhnB protein